MQFTKDLNNKINTSDVSIKKLQQEIKCNHEPKIENLESELEDAEQALENAKSKHSALMKAMEDSYKEREDEMENEFKAEKAKLLT